MKLAIVHTKYTVSIKCWSTCILCIVTFLILSWKLYVCFAYFSLIDTNIHFRVKCTKKGFTTTFEKYSKFACHEFFFSVKKKEKIPGCIQLYRETAGVGGVGRSAYGLQYWMIYGGSGFLAIVWSGSSPTPSPSSVSDLSLLLSLPVRHRSSLLTGEEGERS